ncbi:50S ribosomal protein L18 [Candidatus Gottesmanbacteria bacterium]|nr:50S ribosomal protein L18 [Candidatus Gottesmanbacteria bacterium]
MKTRKTLRLSRQRRIRAVVRGTAARPRLSVYRSGRSLFVQVVDDTAGETIVSLRLAQKNMAAAKEAGVKIAALAQKKGISTVVFDRGGNRYHGVVKALADSAREGGLQF